MSQLPTLIADLALILICAGIMTLLFKKLKQPLVLGYVVAGFLASPHMPFTPSVMDSANIKTWADIGVIFLLFALGLEFSFKKIVKVGGSAIIAACTIIFCMILLGIGVGMSFGWHRMDSLFLGGMIAMSSTTIIYKAFDDLGLKASFERLLDFLNADRDYIMDVEIDAVSCETDDYFCITLYRVVQECLLNIKKHSQATRVLFHCKKTEQKYEILIQDNGKGFTMEEAEDKANSHFGLALIHEDVNLLNGTIHVSSAIGRGTMIDIKIPLDLHSAVKKNS